MKMKTSVVLSSYNGEKYIREQLESLYIQTIQPDEVLIFDDCSEDKTSDIIREFIKDKELDGRWSLEVNEENLGWRKNFVNAICHASGDVIFLCDQDDIWQNTKIEKCIKQMENKDVLLLASDYINFKDGEAPKRILQDGETSAEKVKCDVHFREIKCPGCTYCFRSELKEYLIFVGLKDGGMIPFYGQWHV